MDSPERSQADSRFRVMADGIPFLIWVQGPDGQQEFVNQAYCDFFGVSREEMLGQRWQVLVHPDDKAAYVGKFLACVKEKRPFHGIARVKAADGQWRWIESYGEPRYTDDDEFLGIIGTTQDVTERKMADAALKESEERFQLFMNNTPNLAWVKDEQGRVVYKNSTFLKRFGAKFEGHCGKSDTELWPAANAKTYQESDKAALSSDGPIEVIEEAPNPDGTKSYWHVSKFTYRNEAGERFIGGIASDITARREAEKALQTSESKYRILRESLRDAFVRVAMDGRIVEFNDLYSSMLGYSPEELHSLTYKEITPEEWHKFEDNIVRQQIIPNGYSEVYEKEYRRKDGTILPVELRTILERDEHGKPSGMWATVREITERKRAQNALKESEERLREVLENSLAASYKRDFKKNSYEYLSPVITRITGYTPEEMNSLSIDDVFSLIHQDDRESVKESVVNSQRDDTSQACQIRYRFKSKEGDYRWLLDQFLILKDERQQKTGLIGSVSEITALKMAEDELKRLNDGLENRIKRRTANLVEANKALARRTHQLRRLAGELTMAEQRERKRLSRILHDGLQQYLVAAKFQIEGIIEGSVKEPVEQVASGIYTMLAESLKVARSLSAELSPPILHEAGLFSGLEWLSRWMFEKHRLKVQLAMDIDNPSLTEEVKVLLFESVREMLLNVVKHAGTNIAKVHLIQTQENHLQITVSDNGSGFDLARLASITNGDYGFGLFSIRERMELTGGKFAVDSSPGNGTRFTLTVPLGVAEPLEAVAKKHSEPTGTVHDSSPSSVRGKIRILLADDHAVMREGLARLLGQEEDFDVIGQASDGSEAIERAAALHPDVILMDVSMPNLNGIEATRIIYQRHPEIRIIGLSLYSEEERARKMLEAGATFYMAKSGPASELKAAVRACRDAEAKTNGHAVQRRILI